MHFFLSVANQYKPNHSRSIARNTLLGKLIGGYCFQIHTQNYFKYFYHRPVNVYLRFKIAG